jgi:hypothetical protein
MNYCLAQTVLPADYVAGTDLVISLALASSASGNANMELGILAVSDGDSYSAAPTYTGYSLFAMTGSYNRVTGTFTITGTNYNPGDCISIVIMRDAVAAADTVSTTVLVAGMAITYTSDKLGADV